MNSRVYLCHHLSLPLLYLQRMIHVIRILQCRDRCTRHSPVADSSSKRGREIRCAKCVYVCTLSSEMATHQLSHQFECKKCPYNCSTATNLKQHQQTHMMTKEFLCGSLGQNMLHRCGIEATQDLNAQIKILPFD